MPVRYRYKSSSAWTYVQGDRWELKPIDAQCQGSDIYPKIYFYGTVQSSGGETTFNNFGVPNQALDLIGGKNTKYSAMKMSADRYQAYAECLTPSGQIVNSSQRSSTSYGGSPYRWTAVALARIEYWLQFGSTNFKIDPVTFNPNQWGGASRNSCTQTGCNFKVFAGQTVMLNLIYATCPEVELANCPPDTCSVDCGAYVCCYNSQGISTFNYNK
jgi:hypothetical protein